MSKDARIYEELAAMARGWGYSKVSRFAVHDWRKEGLLLPFGRRGIDGVSTTALARLRRVCELRYGDRIRDLATIRTLLWLEGESIPTEAARTGLLHYLDRLEHEVERRLPTRLRSAGIRARRALVAAELAVDDAAASIVARDPAGWGEPQDRAVVQDGIAELVAGMLGLRQVDEATLGPATLYLGLDRARTEAPPGADPWLSEEAPAALRQSIDAVNLPSLRRVLIKASDAELEAARALAVRLLASAPAVAAAMTLGFGKGAFGLGPLAGLAGEARLGAVFLALLLPDEMALVARATEEQAEQMHTALILGRRYLEGHPELRDEIAQRGMRDVLSELEEPLPDPT